MSFNQNISDLIWFEPVCFSVAVCSGPSVPTPQGSNTTDKSSSAHPDPGTHTTHWCCFPILNWYREQNIKQSTELNYILLRSSCGCNVCPCCPLLLRPAGWWSANSSSAPKKTMPTSGTSLCPPACLFRQVLDLVSPAVPVQALSPASPRACCSNSLPHFETQFTNIHLMFRTQNSHKAQGLNPNPLCKHPSIDFSCLNWWVLFLEAQS